MPQGPLLVQGLPLPEEMLLAEVVPLVVVVTSAVALLLAQGLPLE